MDGKMLEYRGERIYNEGKKDGKIEELLSLVYDNVIPLEVAVDRAQGKHNISKDDFVEMLKSYKPDDESKPRN